MDIFLISRIKNESDIIESFIRYHENIVDGMVVIDNGSTDGTRQILEKLKDEGLPIFLLYDNEAEHVQNQKMTELLNYTVEKFNPDIIVPLDADEFLISTDIGINPRDIMEQLNENSVHYIKWKTYIPKELNDEKIFLPSRYKYTRQEQVETFYKVIFSKKLVNKHQLSIMMGNHDVKANNEYQELSRLVANRLKIAHFPLRSINQFFSKTIIGWLNDLSRYDRKFGDSFHWGRMYSKIKSGIPITQEDLVKLAKNYALQEERQDIELINDIFDTSFCKEITLKYNNKKSDDFMKLILENSEEIARGNAKLKRELLQLKRGEEINQKLKKTSIIILTYNKLEYTKACIDSIRTYTRKGTYEIIVVDNNSSDGTQQWLSKQQDIITIYNQDNVGFPKGCNQGIEVATGDTILLLNNDTVVTNHWLDNLIAALYSSKDIGAVGPVTNNCSYYQAISVPYTNSLDEMHEFAKEYNVQNSLLWEQRIKLVGYCMLIKKEVIDEIGLLDEQFTPGNFEDDDYSYRILQAGYRMILCKDTFIHHFGSVSFGEQRERYTNLLNKNAMKFKEKWGFDSRYSSFIRNEIVNLIDSHDLEDEIRVLEVGCACGATLLQIKNKYKNAKLYGIEFNENSASIASQFSKVQATDAEKPMNYPEEFFDYIIFADVLEHLNNPWGVLENIKKYLKDGGKILASIPNVMHYSVLKDTINGNWTYTESGLLDRTHLRFFTLNEIIKMFNEINYINIVVSATTLPETPEEKKWVDILSAVSDTNNRDQFKAYQYLIKAQKSTQLHVLLGELTDERKKKEFGNNLLAYCKSEKIEASVVIQALTEMGLNGVDTLNFLASLFYQDNRMEEALTFLEKSYSINQSDVDTLFNLGFILHVIGEKELALRFLTMIKSPDEEVTCLIEQINLELNKNISF